MTDNIPSAFASALAAYVEWLHVHHYRPGSIRSRHHGVSAFAVWCGQHGICVPGEVFFETCEQYAAHLEVRIRRDGGGCLSRSTRVSLLGDVREFFRYLVAHDLAAWNPAADVDVPLPQPQGARNPGALTISEIEQVLLAPDTATPDGLRDRAVLETLYSTGIRRGELVRLSLEDVYADGVIRIDDGKGGKDRVVPIGQRALLWIARYRTEVRVARDPLGDVRTLFLTSEGNALTERILETVVTRCFRLAGIPSSGGCHLLRHTCATHLLDGGADLPSVQRMLGHTRITTTGRYTHPDADAVHAVWQRTHPAAQGRNPVAGEPANQAPPRVVGITRQPTSWWLVRKLQQQVRRA